MARLIKEAFGDGHFWLRDDKSYMKCTETTLGLSWEVVPNNDPDVRWLLRSPYRQGKHRVYLAVFHSGQAVLGRRGTIRHRASAPPRVPAVFAGLVGCAFENNKGLSFMVIDRTEDRSIYTCRFEETGTVVHSTKDHILTGRIKDYNSRTVCGVAYGFRPENFDKSIEWHVRAYSVWSTMIRRVYDNKRREYKFYGARGVRVSERWLRFALFFEDIQSLPGFESWKNQDNYDLDKDGIGDGKLYSKDTCQFISHKDNVMLSRRA